MQACVYRPKFQGRDAGRIADDAPAGDVGGAIGAGDGEFFHAAGGPARVQPVHVVRKEIAHAVFDSEDTAEVLQNSSSRQVKPATVVLTAATSSAMSYHYRAAKRF